MVELEGGKVTVTMRQLTGLGAMLAILSPFIAALVAGVMMFATLRYDLERRKEETTSLRRDNDAMKKDLEDFKVLYNNKHQQLNDLVNLQGSREDSLSGNIRVVESNLNSISASLTVSIRDQSESNSKILEKVNDLGTKIAEMGADVKWLQNNKSGSRSFKTEP